MDVKKINFKDRKYVFPVILYPLVLFVGYFVIDAVETDVSDNDPRLATTDYLNSDLPSANTDSVLGGKLDNAEREYGKINDVSGVENVENDIDSINKKEDYNSQYSNREAEMVQRQQAQQRAKIDEQRRIREMQDRVRKGANASRSSSSSDNFVAPVSDSEIARLDRRRRQREIDKMNEDLSGVAFGSSSGRGRRDNVDNNDSIEDDYGLLANGSRNERNTSYDDNGSSYSSRTSDNNRDVGGQAEGNPEKVVKKVKASSDYFNTLSSSSEESKLIKAIIDENVKAQEGSRVRLRLLDDVEIGDITVKKGTYLYAQMSGFSQQRVKGNVKSVFCRDEIINVSLSIYDTDGLEGLYVPQSSFRETTKEILGSATQGGTNIVDNTTSSTGIKGWANNAVQNASQHMMNAVGKAVRKNRVKLKYGTLVYLIDGSRQEKRNRY
ncbi:conjugative transposon protein TraM [Hoylesella timonensis]|uniref:Conjugative transposon protein TraM n=1 Tax=Hoylesella timonensis TaxID=386414 RepID=A0A2K0XHT0_9BACT|nr:conjugative transposon protein TraM [Hoylesella timonensis]PNP94093.1 conjugative transposon protein TraM [Hoylesella timonensis]